MTSRRPSRCGQTFLLRQGTVQGSGRWPAPSSKEHVDKEETNDHGNRQEGAHDALDSYMIHLWRSSPTSTGERQDGAQSSQKLIPRHEETLVLSL